jgi:cation diffusion facilitator family transporter
MGVNTQLGDSLFERPFLVGLLGNLGLAGFKLVFGLLAYSRLVLMDGLFSFMAATACLLPWQAEILQKRLPDERHPYGLGKVLFLSMAGVGALGLIIAVHMFFYSLTIVGWLRAHPSRVMALMVTGISIFANEVLYRYLMDKSRNYANGMMVTSARYNRIGVLISCFVLILLILPYLGVTAVGTWGVAIVALIVFIVGMKMIYNGFAGIMDRAPSKRVMEAIRACADRITDVKDIVNINARYVGTLLHIDLSVAVDERIDMKRAHAIAQDVKMRVIKRIPFAKEVNVIIA